MLCLIIYLVTYWGWPYFSHYILFEVGDGSRVKCCQNLWCGGEHSKDAFSRVIQDQPG